MSNFQTCKGMSRNSENSAGDGSSIESSPRIQSTAASKGPSGDYAVQKTTIVYKINEFALSSDEDNDAESFELKMEYLQRLKTIREKLASIDIANKNYYSDCFRYPPPPPPGPTITEVTEEEAAKLQESQESEVKTILQYGGSFHTESSSLELIELNYNPPKKKACLRETTPKVTKSDGSLSLPYHVQIGLHDNVEKPNLDNIKNRHIFPEVVIEPKPTNGRKDNLGRPHLDSPAPSETSTPKSHKTIVTETTTTPESPVSKPKRRRLLMRSARNKIRPIDSLTLWEEIRTTEALNNRKYRGGSGSTSKDSYYETVLMQNESDPDDRKLGAVSMGGLDVPRKSGPLSTRFPSITKITKMFKSRKTEENTSAKGKDPELAAVPKEAHTLMNLRREQEFRLENEQRTPSSEERSECAAPEEDIDTYYEPYCLFCFCFDMFK